MHIIMELFYPFNSIYCKQQYQITGFVQFLGALYEAENGKKLNSLLRALTQKDARIRRLRLASRTDALLVLVHLLLIAIEHSTEQRTAARNFALKKLTNERN